jgi:hypothetical protein
VGLTGGRHHGVARRDMARVARHVDDLHPFVDDEPVTVRDLERLSRTATNRDGMRRWSCHRGGYPDGS